MEWAKISQQDTLFFKIDFEKAYDNIEFHFILAMLKSLGFDPIFIILIHKLYIHSSTVMMLDGM